MKTFLVTGGAGFIGSHLVHALVRRGERVRVLDNLSTGSLANLQAVQDDVELIVGDATDPHVASAAVAGVDTVFHEAALPSVSRSVEDPLASHRDCVTSTVALLDAARLHGVRRFVYAASSSAYGNCEDLQKHEQLAAQPVSPYAAAKLAGEYYCRAFAATYGLSTICLRYFNVFGPRQDPASPYSAVIPLFITALLKGRSPVIFGDGAQSRDFTYIDNVVHGNLCAAAASKRASGRVFNVAMGQSTSLLQLIDSLQQRLQTAIQPEHKAARVGDVLHSLADIRAAKEFLNYEPVVSFDEGLGRTIDYYRAWLCEQSQPAAAPHAQRPATLDATVQTKTTVA
ncbi:MAG: SDR family oxidoreductase [Pirellulales bacterium]